MTRTIAAMVSSLALMSVLAACGDDGERGDDPTADAARPTHDGTSPFGPLPELGTSSCVQEYSPEHVAELGFAFDGVVSRIGSATTNLGDDSDLDLAGVTFEVRDWFGAGTGRTVTVDMPLPVVGRGGSAEGGVSYSVGSRLLISGQPRWGGSPLEDPIAWSCGFSRYYDVATATAWGNATR